MKPSRRLEILREKILGTILTPFLPLRLSTSGRSMLLQFLPQCGWHRDSCDVSACALCDISRASSETFSQGSRKYTSPSSANLTFHFDSSFSTSFKPTHLLGIFSSFLHVLLLRWCHLRISFLSSAVVFTSTPIRKFKNEYLCRGTVLGLTCFSSTIFLFCVCVVIHWAGSGMSDTATWEMKGGSSDIMLLGSMVQQHGPYPLHSHCAAVIAFEPREAAHVI